MVVSVLYDIVRRYRFQQIKIQFVSHGDGYYRHNEKYDGCVYVTPRNSDGKLYPYGGRYYYDKRFKNDEFRSQFYKLVRAYNKNHYEQFGKIKVDDMFSSETKYFFR